MGPTRFRCARLRSGKPLASKSVLFSAQFEACPECSRRRNGAATMNKARTSAFCVSIRTYTTSTFSNSKMANITLVTRPISKLASHDIAKDRQQPRRGSSLEILCFIRTFALLGKIQEFSGLIPGSKGKVRKSCLCFFCERTESSRLRVVSKDKIGLGLPQQAVGSHQGSMLNGTCD